MSNHSNRMCTLFDLRFMSRHVFKSVSLAGLQDYILVVSKSVQKPFYILLAD